MSELVEDVDVEQEERKKKGDLLDDRKRQQASDLLYVMRSREGQRFIAWLLDDACSFHGATFIADGRAAAFADGRRYVGSRLRDAAIACDQRIWLAIEMDVINRRIEMKDKPKGSR